MSLAALHLLMAGGLAGVLLFVQTAVQGLTGDTNDIRDDALPSLLIVLLLGSAAGVLRVVSMRIQRMLTVRVDRHTTAMVLRAAAHAELQEFENPEFHDQLQRAIFASRSKLGTLVTVIVAVVQTLLAAVAVASAFLAMAWWLLPLAVVSAVPVLKAARDDRNSRYELHHDLSESRRMREYLERLLTGRDEAKELRALKLGELLHRRWSAAYDQEIQGHSLVNQRYMWSNIRARVVADTVVLAVVGLASWLVVASVLELSEVAAGLTGLWLLSMRAQMVGGMLSGVGESVLYLEDLRTFTSIPTQAQASPHVAIGTIKANRVTFAYPGTDRPVLREVSVSVSPGQIVALVGVNGSGKTTLAKVLVGLYRPNSGAVLLENEVVTDSQVLREISAIVFQDFVRYKLSALDNVTFGRWDSPVEKERVQWAMAQSGADQFVAELPMGVDTILGREFAGGTDLSGGQWQRLAIARAFYRDAPFLVLDEPTSALDPKAEEDLFFHIRDWFADRAVLLISHRFSSVRKADWIYVMEDGEVVEEGRHETLMEMGGKYAHMFNVQARPYR